MAQIPGATWIPKVMLQCAAVSNGWVLAWESVAQHKPVVFGKRAGAPRDYPVLDGRIEILPLQEIYGDWTGIIDFDFMDEPSHEWRKTFKVVDWIYGAEECVGIFHDNRRDSQLYYCNLEDEPEPLDIDLPGYLTLAQHTLAGRGWQDVVRALSGAFEAEEAIQEYSAKMWNVFGDFDIRKTTELYSELRLNRGARGKLA
jgi:hypothetical protein